LESDQVARRLISRSILIDAIFELWGQGENYNALHASIQQKTRQNWANYKHDSFRFSVHGFQGKRDKEAQTEIIDSFKYLSFEGPIRMKGCKHEFSVFEQFEAFNPVPKKLYFGRLVGNGGRHAVATYDLKRRAYINTTSMDAELALLTANIAQAAPGKLYLDPFVGTAGFPIACAHFGAMTIGSDIDGRSIRGKNGRDVQSNFSQYGLTPFWLDALVSDLTNSPVRRARWLDGIVCDPPYGVREPCKVLGSSHGVAIEKFDNDGVATHLYGSFILGTASAHIV
jgi:tRNA (guanine10-N2)-methyltransferase